MMSDKHGNGDTEGRVEMGVGVMLDGCETESDDDALHLFSKPCATTEKPRQARRSRLPSPSTTIHSNQHQTSATRCSALECLPNSLLIFIHFLTNTM